MWLMVLALANLQPAGPEISVAEFERGDIPDLARRLLPADVAARIVEGRVHPPRMFSSYGVSFMEAPQIAGRHACRREMHGVSFAFPPYNQTPRPEMRLAPVSRSSWTAVIPTYPRRADAVTCADSSVWVQVRPGQVEPTVAAMDRLNRVIRSASRNRRLPFEFGCQPSSDRRNCDYPQRVLASLSFRYLIEASAGPRDRNGEERDLLTFDTEGRTGRRIEVTLTRQGERIVGLNLRHMDVHTH